MRRTLIVLILALVTAATASAQNVINPRWVEFAPSSDHASVTYYEVRFFLQGATQPISTGMLGKPTPVANLCKVDINTLIIALPLGTGYTARVVAVNSLGEGVSAPSNSFRRRK